MKGGFNVWPILIVFLGVALLVLAMFKQPSWFFVVLSVLAFGGFFWFLEGNPFLFILYMFGVFLMVLELYIPDFGLAGLAGIFALVYSLSQMVTDFSTLILIILGSLLTGILVAAGMLKTGHDLVLSPGFVLTDNLQKASSHSRSADGAQLLGEVGLSQSPLRPVGKALIQDHYYEVYADGAFIDVDIPVRVVNVSQNKIYVRRDDV